MVISVAFAVALLLHQTGWSVEDMFGRRLASGFLCLAQRRLVGRISSVGFRREGQIGHSLSQRQFALGAADPLIGFPRMQADRLRLWISEADILDRHAQDASCEISWVFTTRQHPGQPIERGIRI